MKNIINKSIWVSSVFLLMFSLNSCLENTDLVTEEALTGGLVNPVTANFPYKLGATPNFTVDLSIPDGPGIASIKVMNSYTDNVAGVVSDEVLLTTVNLANSNAGKDVEKSITLTYADLSKGIKLDGESMPTDELVLNIGDFWILRYISVMADGREVVNNLVTTIAVANQYAGNYLCTGTFNHPTAGPRPINEEKFLTPVSASKCYTALGDLGGAGYDIYINVESDNTCTVTIGPGAITEVFMMAGLPNVFNPSDKSFDLNYFYTASSGDRIITEHYAPL